MELYLYEALWSMIIRTWNGNGSLYSHKDMECKLLTESVLIGR